MTRLPSVTPREVIAALKRAGFQTQRSHGSHVFLWHPQRDLVTTVAMHTREMPRGTLKVKQAGLTEDEFRALL